MTRASDLAKVLSGGTISTADNGTQLTLESTDTDANAGPHLRLYRSVAGADSDNLGQIEFSGQDDAGNEFKYAQIESFLVDASNGTEDGYLEFQVGHGGTERVSRLLFSGTEAVINQDSKDLDFRVESNGNANMLFVDGGNDIVAIGKNSSDTIGGFKNTLQVEGTGATTSSISVTRNTNDSNPAYLQFGKSRGTSVGSNTIVQDDDEIAQITFNAADGTNRDTPVASIRCSVDGTPGENDMPGRLMFHTTADGASSSTERLRIDSLGYAQLGATLATHVGTSQLFINRGVNSLPATSGTTQTGGALRLRGNDNAVLDMGMNSVYTWIQATDRANLSNGYSLYLNPNGGNVAIGTSDTTYTNIGRLVSNCNLASFHTAVFRNDTNNTGGLFLRMMNHAGQDCGSISQNGTTTVSYATSSDYRLKENVIYDFDATSRLKQLKPARFNFIADGTDKVVDGFLAHEVSSIVPEAVVGTKDGTRDIGTLKDADGNILYENVFESAKEEGQTWTKTKTENVYQGVDLGKIVPLLVKTIQELEARITTPENA